ncbi:MAG TPA: ISAs1 family transposase [Candidatus Tectomicrobia bacterium]|nr:ISAs1 family transposase [Candidatus Tectomicrobia bacterium]
MDCPIRPLVDTLHDIPDPRHPRGRRHPLVAILALMCVAMLCGYRSYRAIAHGGRCYGQPLMRALGFTRAKTPCAATLYHVLRQLDSTLVEASLGAWAESILTALPPPPGELEAMAIDGKTLRGSRKQGAPAAHLLSVLSHRLGLTLWQQAVADKTHEIPVLEEVLQGLVVEGRVITVDALLTQRAIAQRIVAGGGDYVMVVKGNQPQLHQDIHLLFQDTFAQAAPMVAAETVDIGHGRIEQRRLTASTALVGYHDWPGLAQVFQLERHVTLKASRAQRADVVYGVTSLSPEQTGPERLLGLIRQHWQIENQVHWVRDVTFEEDRSQVRGGSIPQVMAAFRNTAIGLMHWAGETNIAAACRRFAAQPWSALALIGITPDN